MTQQTKTARTRASRGSTAEPGHIPSPTSNGARPGAVRVSCPVCSSRDRIEKVSNIVRSGRGRLVWEDGEVSHYETELSELLDEPPPPKHAPIYRPLVDAVPPLLVLAAIFGVLGIIRAQTTVYVPENALDIARNIAVAWFALVIPSVLVLQYVQGHLEHRKEMPKWVHARRRWTGLYYCPRDDVVFAPNLKMIASPPEMRSLLYPSESLTDEHIQQLAAGGLWEATTTK